MLTIGIITLGLSAMAEAQIVVNRTTDNTGTCTAASCNLRQAIAAANATTVRDTIVFDLPNCGPNVINITGSTLRITRPIIIDGTTQPLCGNPIPGDRTSLIELRGQGANVGTPVLLTGLLLDTGSSGSTIRGLAINGFSGSGIAIASSNNFVDDNKIGTNAAGTQARANTTGISIGDSTTGNDIGNNVISGNNAMGINVLGNNSQIFDNLIGTAVNGQTNLGNGGDGIATSGAINVEIGIAASIGNTIAFNDGHGVHISAGSSANEVIGNDIHDNGGLGIRLDGAASNGGQVAPVITSAARSFQSSGTFPPRILTVTTISGTLANVNGSTGFRVDLYGNDELCPSNAIEGHKFLTTAVVNPNGTFSTTTTQSSGASITGVARSPDENSSRFSACRAVTSPF